MSHRFDIGVAVLTAPFISKSVYTVGKKVVDIVSSICKTTIYISGNIPTDIEWPEEVVLRDVGFTIPDLRKRKPLLFFVMLWAFKNYFVQVLMAVDIFRFRDQIEIIVCFSGNQYQIPILISKALGKKVICGSAGIGGHYAKYSYGDIWEKIALFTTKFNFYLSDVVVIESSLLTENKTLMKWKNKLRNGALYLDDIELFSIEVPIIQRGHEIGFIGRFSSEKGILEFLDAIPAIIEIIPHVEILLIGSGPLDNMVDEIIGISECKENIRRLSWVDHKELPVYLNKMKLLVIPSKSEGLPNIIFEAFGCGTVVLASPVGGVPEIVIDGETGFLIHNISPEAFAFQIAEILQMDSKLNEITKRAKDLLQKDYLMDSAIDRYSLIVKELIS